MKPLVITTCSAGKRSRSPVRVKSIAKAAQRELAKAWLQRLSREKDKRPAIDLYKGRAFAIARTAAEEIAADFVVLSAGLGVVRGSVQIPPYDLTVRPGVPSSVTERVIGEFNPVTWWTDICRGPFSSDLQDECKDRTLVLVSISQAYLELTAKSLASVAQKSGALRIFGLSLDRSAPPALSKFIMPYDKRLEALGTPGTRTDFGPRALADFVENVLPRASTLEAQVKLVRRRMAGAPALPPPRPQRRADDQTLKREIASSIKVVGHRGGLVLRRLRRDLGWSCEQKRFATLFKQVCAEQVTR